MATKFNAAFWKWFGDSKVTNSNGNPMVVYHGTDELWTKARSRKEAKAYYDALYEGLTDQIVSKYRETSNRSAGSVWFTDDEEVAYGYKDSDGENSGVIRAYLKIEKPLDLRSIKTSIKKIEDLLGSIFDKTVEIDDTYGKQLGVARAIVWDNSKVIQYAIDSGYDGIIHDDTDISGRHTHTSYVTFEPEKIKSIDNDGTWDSDDQDIRSNPEYSGEHSAPMSDSGAPLWNLSGIFPDDIYGPNAAKYYAHYGDGRDWEAINIIQWAHDRPSNPITIYRAIPEGVRGSLNPGDWVTTVRKYAKEHGESNLGQGFKIYSKTVNVRDLFTDGNSIFEFGYDPQPWDREEVLAARARRVSRK